MKTVNLIINVPDSEYCWDGKECCPQFDNTAGCGCCDYNLGDIIKTDDMTYKKPKECLELL